MVAPKVSLGLRVESAQGLTVGNGSTPTLSNTNNSRGSAPAMRSPSQPALQPNVFARLQALFPSSIVSPQSDMNSISNVSAPANVIPSSPKFLKIRINTWNMHESIPKGNLEELLGIVPPYHPPSSERTDPLMIPGLVTGNGHPYHMVILAGQECPSVSGIPMALGAGFKLKDKEREKEKEKDHPKTKHKDKDEHDNPLEILHSSGTPNGVAPHAGWTSLLEDWLCKGVGSVPNASSEVAETATTTHPSKESPESTSIPNDVGRYMESNSPGEQRLGPYELLTKERMMGLHLAIYIHRDIKHLVEGTSKSAVAAGLIGGRVGNKGGVAVSIKICGTTLLFINAHLAAHEGKVAHRLANLAKIKNELTVDDFLSHDDPRVMAEDLTDKFDFTFIFGDLNFRLDISRLHADWLIARQEYAQALAFDQLRNLMARGEAFVGFNEAPIDFPPTFKYDVLRTLKRRSKKKVLSRRHSNHVSALLEHEHDQPVCELDEKEGEGEDMEDREDREDGEDDGEADGEGGESASMASSAWTSIQSKYTTDVDAEDEDYFHLSPPVRSTNIVADKVQKLLHGPAAHKAKSKVMALLSPTGSPGAGTPLWRRHGSKLSLGIHLTPSAQSVKEQGTSASLSLPVSSTLQAISNPELGMDTSAKHASIQPQPMARAHSSRGALQKGNDDGDGDKGVYDSSSKKRVPSWCDRILWKSTVEADVEPDDGEWVENSIRPRTRVGQLLAYAFRRGRRESYASSKSSDLSSTRNTVEDAFPPPPVSSPFSSPVSDSPISPHSPPLSRILPNHAPDRSAAPLRKSNTIEPLPTVKRTGSFSSLRGHGRSFSAITSVVESHSNTVLMSPDTASPLAYEEVELPPTAIPPSPLSPTSQAAPGLSQPRWRFLPFLRGNASVLSLDMPLPTPPPQLEPKPCKGDVVCINYNTLDDRGMRRLEGRSDHRPVIGSYAIYI